ncbi:hypothetical protein [Pseudofrankia inefficax]|uniref:Uncharacterized protein n=1 Tax=Pseudofrankia inefficax (strain DSM 45817 / CECT 9037 / DDB 130130 / EuI1c) TaxID=298654 RepID=E3JDQ9_PSEI1|nr:hypothetical protein [Pseudofrankia inefficax]ADP84825.1 hypothetical protein FraEuI1c_6856 [Pseudofrankia inefficax]
MQCINCGADVVAGTCTNTACPLSRTNPRNRPQSAFQATARSVLGFVLAGNAWHGHR